MTKKEAKKRLVQIFHSIRHFASNEDVVTITSYKDNQCFAVIKSPNGKENAFEFYFEKKVVGIIDHKSKPRRLGRFVPVAEGSECLTWQEHKDFYRNLYCFG